LRPCGGCCRRAAKRGRPAIAPGLAGGQPVPGRLRAREADPFWRPAADSLRT
jgi:hypothetical protein